MDLASNNLQKLICHKTQQTKPYQTKPFFKDISIIVGYLMPKLAMWKNRSNTN